MERERIGGVPFETRKEGSHTVIRFYPKTESALNRDKIVFVLKLDESDRTKLKKLL